MKLFIPKFTHFKDTDLDIINFCVKIYKAQSYYFTIFKHNNENRMAFITIGVEISQHVVIIDFPYKRLKENE